MHVITITGTPTASGTFSYTIPLDGGCGTVSATGTITVDDLPTVDAGSDQTVCGGDNVTLNGSGASTYTWDNGVTNNTAFTASTTTTYTVTGTDANGCINTDQVTVTITPDNTAGSPSTSPTVCINTALTDITIATTGATGIGTATGLPSGVTAAWSSDVITVSGTPTASGTFSYTIPLDGGCGSVNATGTITVSGDNTAGTASTTPTLCVNTALTDITHATTGATGIGTASGLPSGVTASWSSDVITITGTPTASGTFSYTIPLDGGCGTVSATGTITVDDLPTVDAGSDQTVCGGDNVTLNGSGASTYTWDNGVTNNTAFTASTTTTYTVTGTDANGCINTDQVTVTITPDNTAGSPSTSPTVCINTALTDITIATTGATGIGTATGLPSGVTAAWSSDVITVSGTPTASGTFSYTIPLDGGCGSVNATGTITVSGDNTAGTASTTPTLCVNTALTDITHATTGATGIGTASGLPSGVTASWSSDVITITGTPTASGTFSYTIPLDGGCGTVSATGTITVDDLPTVDAGSDQTVCGGDNVTLNGSGASTYTWDNGVTNNTAFTASTTTTYTVTGTDANGCINTDQVTVTITPDNTAGSPSTSPTVCINTALTDITIATTGATGIGTATGLPSGVTAAWSSDVITVSGTPTASGTFSYTIPLDGGCGSVNATGTITVSGDNTAGTASTTPTLCVNTALTDITHATTGATGIGTASGLPSGVTASWSSDVITITGTPTASGTFSYTIPLDGGCGTVSATGTITVDDLPTVDAGSDQTVCGGDNVTLNGSGASTYTWDNGVTNNTAFTASTTTTYTVTGTDANGCINTDQVTITLTATNTVSVNGAYDISTATYVQNFSIGSQETAPNGMSFNNDGTKMYVTGYSGDDVNEYSLSTAFDVSTASYVQNFLVRSQDTSPMDISFNNDGSKMFVIGLDQDYVSEYNLTSLFNISTASYAGNAESFYMGSYEARPQGLTFNNNGTKMYIIGTDNRRVNEYNLSTAFDVSTASYVQLFSINAQETSPRGIIFNNNGTKMFIVGSTGDDVNEYNLSTAFDVSTASYTQNFSVAAQEPHPTDVSFNNDGTKMFVLGFNNRNILEYSLDNLAVQTVCVNDAITNITFNTTGATGIGSATNLPTGVTAAWSSNVLTISGTPSVAGTFAYSVPLTGGCGTVAATGTITVLPTESPAFSYGSATYCETDSDPTPTVTGTTGGTFSATPSGLSINASTGAIDLSASTMGTYAVKYVTSSSICADSTTFSVTLTATNTVSLNGAYDISTATYVQDFSVGSQENAPTGLTFNNDGTKMYILGETGDDVDEYNLSTAFDVSTASYVQTFAVGSQEINPQGIVFNNDGTKMYISGYNGDDVNEYSLSTAFDISTASYVQRFVVSGQETAPTGLTFNNDGTKMFVIGSTGDDVNEYALSTAFDVTTAAYTQVFSVNSQEINPQGMSFNNDGTKMFVIGNIGDDVNEYSLSTAFDVSTASYVQNFSVSSQELTPADVTFNNDGSKMFVVGSSGDKVYEYNLDNPSSPTVCVNDAITNITYNTTGATGIGSATNLPTGVTAAWSSNVLTISGTPSVAGTYAYSVPLTGGCGSVAATGTITVLPTESPAFTYASATYCETDSDPTPTVTGTSGGTFSASPSGLSINASTGAIALDASIMGTYAVKYVTSSSVCADSTTFNVTLTATNTVYVNGAYDISTASYVQNFSVASQETAPSGITFNNDGTKMYVLGDAGNDVNEYSLSTAFDVSTASYVTRISVAETNPSGMSFNNDGTKMFIIGYNSDYVLEYDLTTAFDVSSAVYAGSAERFYVRTQETFPHGLTFNNDGTKMYVIGSTGDDVNEYSLSTAFDVSTASYTQLFSVVSQESYPQGITFNNDGTKMYVIGSWEDEVNEYSLSTAFDVSTASYTQLFSVASQDLTPTGISFNNDGTKMFVIGSGFNKVYEYSLDNPSVQTVCINSAITNITYNTTGATGIGTATNLPTGVTAAWSSNVLTISGTPSVAGTYAYSVPLTGGCGTVNATGTITVTDISAPTAGTITQPTCAVATGSFTIASFESTSTYTFTPSGPTVDGTAGVVTLAAGATYTFTETNAAGCESAASLDVVIDAQPATPSAPVAGTITQPTCAVATGSFTIASFESTSTYTFHTKWTNGRWYNWRSNSSSRSNLYVYRNECSRM